MPKKRWPCKPKAGRLTPCWALSESLEDPSSRGTRQQGLRIMSFVNRNSLKFSRELVTVKSGSHSQKGLVANFCPFCGTKINQEAPDAPTSA